MNQYIASAADLERYLKEGGNEFLVTPQGFVVRFESEGRFTVVNVMWEAQPRVVRFFTSLPVRVTADRAEDVAVAIGELNASLVAGYFLRYAEGVVFATHAFLDHGGVLSALVLERSMAMCRRSATELAPVVLAAAHPSAK